MFCVSSFRTLSCHGVSSSWSCKALSLLLVSKGGRRCAAFVPCSSITPSPLTSSDHQPDQTCQPDSCEDPWVKTPSPCGTSESERSGFTGASMSGEQSDVVLVTLEESIRWQIPCLAQHCNRKWKSERRSRVLQREMRGWVSLHCPIYDAWTHMWYRTSQQVKFMFLIISNTA